MRLWLSVAFALVVAATAGLAAKVFLERFENEFRERTSEFAAGYAVAAAIDVVRADEREAALDSVVDERAVAPLFVFDEDGKLLTSPRSHGVAFSEVPDGGRAVESALEGRRFIETPTDGGTVVGLPLGGPRARAIVVYGRHPDLVTGLGLARENIVEAAVVGLVVGALAGCLVAWLIARRLGRIAIAAGNIEQGSFQAPVEDSFPDEIGALAAAIDRMRNRLEASFRALHGERDQLEQILERLHEAVVTVDKELRVEFANSQARDLFGGSAVEAGARVLQTWHGFALTAFSSELFEPGASVSHARVEAEGSTFAVVGIPASESGTAVLVIADVSEQERRDRAEREFVSNAAHELRTPLQTILGAVEVLNAGAKDHPEERDRFLAHIDREAMRLAKLSRSLLVLARAQTREEKPRVGGLELAPLLTEIAADLHPQDGVEVEVRCPPDLAVVADRDLLEQALSNLAANAATHTPAGRIVIDAASVDAETALVEVKDTGRGIAPDKRDRIFERFYRGNGRAGDGFGLGLPIAREAVRAVGGTLELESRPGVGTTARVTLAKVRRKPE